MGFWLRVLAVGLLGLQLISCASAPERSPLYERPDIEVEVREATETAVAEASPASSTKPMAEGEIPLDPAVTYGHLDNGLAYYIRPNQKPENRAELRLVVNAGSLVEDDDQKGLAHFIEHMAFNGTENFEKQEIVNYLEKIGMRFGADVNAYTSFDETVYMLQVPTDDPEILETAFRILEDWAHRVSFEDEEIDKERGVVVEEWRLGRGANGRIRDKQLPVIFANSRYEERMVIGDKEILETAPYDTLRRFYRDWYRPDLMAVVAVGDFDAADVEAKIREHFSFAPRTDNPRPRTDYPIPDHEETLVSIVTDPEATSINVVVGYKRPPTKTESVAELRQSLIDDVYDGLLNSRLNELRQKPDPPFRGAFAGSGSLGRSKSIYQLVTIVGDGGVVRGLETLLTEARRVETHGFLESELERAKVQLRRGMERAWEERDKRESNRFASEYIRHFLENEPSPGIDYERRLIEELLPGITLDEVNARAAQWITDDNRVILVSGPDKAEAGIPEEQALLAIFDEVDQVAVTPWVDQTQDAPLVAELPKAGHIVEEETIEELGTTRWVLSNGVEVLLKPTDFKNDEVLLSGYSPGGTSLVSDEDYLSATMASALGSVMGAGTFSQIELQKALAGKVARVGASIGELSEGVRASASPKDLETMFQLLYLEFTGLRRDEGAFQAFLTNVRHQLENQEASPGFQFNLKYNEAVFRGHPRRQVLTTDRLAEIDLDRAMAVYRDRFLDASDFLFTIVGNFELDAMRPRVELWLGGLPSTGRQETWRDVGAYAAPEVTKFEVRKGIEPQSSVRLVFHGDAEWSPEEAHLVSSMGAALRIRLREVLREDLGGVYGVGVSGSLSRYPRSRYNISVSFSCDPGRTEELIEALFAELEAMKENGPEQEVVDKITETQRRSRETALEQNGFWLSQLEWHERNGLALTDILDYEHRVELVTQDSIHRVAAQYLDMDRYILGVLYPEAEEGTEEGATSEAAALSWGR